MGVKRRCSSAYDGGEREPRACFIDASWRTVTDIIGRRMVRIVSCPVNSTLRPNADGRTEASGRKERGQSQFEQPPTTWRQAVS